MLEFQISMEQRRRCFAYTQQGTGTGLQGTNEIFKNMFRRENLAAKAFVTDGELYIVLKPNDGYSVWLLGYGKPKRVENFNFGLYYSSIANVYESLDGVYRTEQLRPIPDITWDSKAVPDFLKLVRLTEVVYG